MIEYVAKLEAVARAVEAKHGPFALFGVFMREDSPRLWDLVVSAPWLEEGRLTTLREFVETLASVIGQEAMRSLSRVVTLNRDEPALYANSRRGWASTPTPFEAGSRPLWAAHRRRPHSARTAQAVAT